MQCDGPVVAANNTITGNTSSGLYGAGIFCNGPACIIWNNTVTNNTVSRSSTPSPDMGGGGLYLLNSSASVVGNTITGNTVSCASPANASGGGIFCRGGAPTLYANTIASNTITLGGGSGYGSGIALASASGAVLNNTVSANRGGSGIYADGGSPVLANNIIVSHTDTWTYGISVGSGSARLINNTVVSNYSGMFINGDDTAVVENNIIAFNSAVGIYKGGVQFPTIDCNCVYNPGANSYIGLSAGPRDVSADPAFVDRMNGDYRLRSTSQCIDAGDDEAADPSWVDRNGGLRVQGTHVDMGACEAAGSEWYSLVLSGVPPVAPKGGSIVITAVLCHSGGAIADWPVEFTSSAGTLTVLSAKTDSMGAAQVRVTYSTVLAQSL